jgi:ferredoxin
MYRCCGGGIDAMVNYDIPSMAASGYVAQVNHDLCDDCGECEAARDFGAIRVNGQPAADRDACMGCGVCEGLCPSGAVSLVTHPDKGVLLDVRLMAEDGQQPQSEGSVSSPSS